LGFECCVKNCEFLGIERQLSVGSGQLTVDSGQLTVGSWQLAVGNWQWAIDSGQWAVDSGQLAVDASVRRNPVSASFAFCDEKSPKKPGFTRAQVRSRNTIFSC
jgi:hypothetical protein